MEHLLVCLQRSKKVYADFERYNRATILEVYASDGIPPGNEDGIETCVICLSNFEAGEAVRRLPCRHLFHKACVDGYFSRQVNSGFLESRASAFSESPCPICRQDILKGEKEDPHSKEQV